MEYIFLKEVKNCFKDKNKDYFIIPNYAFRIPNYLYSLKIKRRNKPAVRTAVLLNIHPFKARGADVIKHLIVFALCNASVYNWHILCLAARHILAHYTEISVGRILPYKIKHAHCLARALRQQQMADYKPPLHNAVFKNALALLPVFLRN